MGVFSDGEFVRYAGADGAINVGTGGILGPPLAGIVITEAQLVAGIDASLASTFIVTLTAARLVGAPINAKLGKVITFLFKQNASGFQYITWDAIFKHQWQDDYPQANGSASISFCYDGTNWRQIGGQGGYWQYHAESFRTATEASLVGGLTPANGTNIQVTLTAARVVGALDNSLSWNGQRFTFLFLQDGTGGWAVTWNANFVGLTWSNAGNVAGARSSITFMYVVGGLWAPVSAQTPWVV